MSEDQQTLPLQNIPQGQSIEQAAASGCPVVKPASAMYKPENDTPKAPGLDNKPQSDTPRTPGLENKSQAGSSSGSPDVFGPLGARASPGQENQVGQAAAIPLMARLQAAQGSASKGKKRASDGQKAGSVKKRAPAKPKKTAVEKLADMSRPSVQAVHAALKELGVDDPESVNKCLKRAIQIKYVQLDSQEGLDKVIFEGSCFLCSGNKSATVRDLLFQPHYGGSDYEEGGQDAPIKCNCEGEENGLYVTQLCHGQPTFDSGKFHNHCTECPGFGTCIGDYRMAHCEHCRKHYFCGGSGFPCNCRGRGGRRGFGGWDDDDDEYDSDDDGRQDGCILQ